MKHQDLVTQYHALLDINSKKGSLTPSEIDELNEIERCLDDLDMRKYLDIRLGRR